jgi:hypothetical protein
MNPITQGYLDAYMTKDAAFEDVMQTIQDNPYAGAGASGLGGAAIGGALGAMVGGKDWAIPAAIFGALALAIANTQGFGIDEAIRGLMEMFNKNPEAAKDPVKAVPPEVAEVAATVDEAQALEAAGPHVVSPEVADTAAGVQELPGMPGSQVPVGGVEHGPEPLPNVDQSSLEDIGRADAGGYNLAAGGGGGAKPLPGPGQDPSIARNEMTLDEINQADLIAGGGGEPPVPSAPEPTDLALPSASTYEAGTPRDLSAGFEDPGMQAAMAGKTYTPPGLDTMTPEIEPEIPEPDQDAFTYGSEDSPELADIGLPAGTPAQTPEELAGINQQMGGFGRAQRAQRLAEQAAAKQQALEQEAALRKADPEVRRQRMERLKKMQGAESADLDLWSRAKGVASDAWDASKGFGGAVKQTGSDLGGDIVDAGKGYVDLKKKIRDKAIGVGKAGLTGAADIAVTAGERAAGGAKEHFEGKPDMGGTPAIPGPKAATPKAPAPKAAATPGGIGSPDDSLFKPKPAAPKPAAPKPAAPKPAAPKKPTDPFADW